MSAGTQKDSFHTILSDTLGESCNYEIVKSIHENLNEMIEENKESLDSFALDKKDMAPSPIRKRRGGRKSGVL